MSDDPVRDQNQRAWNAGRYDAWARAEGGAEQAAKEITSDPPRAVRRLLPHLGDVSGARICNLQGSKGKIAIGLALLGAKVTVIDFAHENQRYALETAAWANAEIDYVVADVMDAPAMGLKPFDAVVMELGILHYHQDLERFFAVCAALTKLGGLVVVNDFHPVRWMLLAPPSDTPVNYFQTDLIEVDVPNPTGEDECLGRCLVRRWTLGELWREKYRLRETEDEDMPGE